MAILERGILGGGRNAVGTVVMSRWRGKDVIRARVSPTNPQTPAQVRQRALFGAVVRAGQSLADAFVKPYWSRFARSGTRAQTAFNAWTRQNVYAMRYEDGLRPAGEFDALKLVLTDGPLAPVPVQAVEDDGAGGTAVAYSDEGGAPDDAVAVAVISLADGSLAGTYTGFRRDDGSATVPVPFQEAGQYAFHVVPYRPGATDAETAVGPNTSGALDEQGSLVTLGVRGGGHSGGSGQNPPPAVTGALSA